MLICRAETQEQANDDAKDWHNTGGRAYAAVCIGRNIPFRHGEEIIFDAPAGSAAADKLAAASGRGQGSGRPAVLRLLPRLSSSRDVSARALAQGTRSGVRLLEELRAVAGLPTV